MTAGFLYAVPSLYHVVLWCDSWLVRRDIPSTWEMMRITLHRDFGTASWLWIMCIVCDFLANPSAVSCVYHSSDQLLASHSLCSQINISPPANASRVVPCLQCVNKPTIYTLNTFLLPTIDYLETSTTCTKLQDSGLCIWHIAWTPRVLTSWHPDILSSRDHTWHFHQCP